jgi:hypothetical protein
MICSFTTTGDAGGDGGMETGERRNGTALARRVPCHKPGAQP